jgi:hypothetical protein
MTVLVADGFYSGDGNYNISTAGKMITIRSWNGRSVTTISSGGSGPVFNLSSGETTNTVILGFSLTTTLSACSDGDCDEEQAVVLSGAGPRIKDCRIYNCELAGILCSAGAAPIIEGCVIENVLRGIDAVNSTPAIIDCQIRNIGNGLAGAAGIGIKASGSFGMVVQNTGVSNCLGRGIAIVNDPKAQIIGCTLISNFGGLTLDNSGSKVERCIIRANDAPTYYSRDGAGWVSRTLFDLSDTNATDTVSEDENGGGILLLRGASPLIRNCLVAENYTWADDPAPHYNAHNEKIQDYGLGGGIYVGTDCNPTGVNCTVANNHSNTRGGGMSSSGNPLVLNMIYWGNTANDALILTNRVRVNRLEYPNLNCRSGNIRIGYSDIQYGYGAGLDATSTTNNPLFVGGGDYHLSASNSPCFNSGIYYLNPTNDLDGDPRPVALPQKIDMGCYEFTATLPTLDTDGDGVSDVVETSQGTNPNNSDTDGDGFTDGAEDITGTDPLSAVSYFDVGYSNSPAGNVLLTWGSVPGRLYTVQTRTDLVMGIWSNAPGYTDLAGTGCDMYFTNSLPDVVRYYRIQVRLP